MHKTVNDIIAKKGSKKISVVTSYDYTMATLCDQVDILLVGDSAGMVMLGYENTAPVTMDEMVLFTKAVSNARENALIVADLPNKSYENEADAVANSERLIRAGADAVKLEGRLPDIIRAIIKAGIPVMGHLGLLPQTAKKSANFVASILCSSITNLERQGLDAALLKPEHIIESFELLASGKIPKESLEIIFESIMSGKSENVSLAMQSADVSSMDEDELNEILDGIVQKNIELVRKLGENVVTTLMGIAMKEVRGKASGKIVNDLLRKKIQNI